jgi:hypothetical protein
MESVGFENVVLERGQQKETAALSCCICPKGGYLLPE